MCEKMICGITFAGVKFTLTLWRTKTCNSAIFCSSFCHATEFGLLVLYTLLVKRYFKKWAVRGGPFLNSALKRGRLFKNLPKFHYRAGSDVSIKIRLALIGGYIILILCTDSLISSKNVLDIHCKRLLWMEHNNAIILWWFCAAICGTLQPSQPKLWLT
jgi:hypothetical protein